MMRSAETGALTHGQFCWTYEKEHAVMSTGMPGLDRVLQGLRPGDNVVWEVDEIEDYLPVLGPFCNEARRLQAQADLFPLCPPCAPAEGGLRRGNHVSSIPQEGFERFLTDILDVIEQAGPGAFYVFDCLSDLAADWFSDRMLGNFFMIACPYLYELDTIAYFALLKNQHSFHATQPIFNTAQVIIEVYRKEKPAFHPSA